MFSLLSATAWFAAAPAFAESFTLSTSQLQIVAIPPANHAPVGVAVTAPADFDYNNLQVQSDSQWVTPTVDGANHEIVLSFDTAGLINSTYTATLTATQGSDTVTFFVKANISLMNISKLVKDPARPRVYGIHQNGLLQGAVVIYEPLQGKLVGSVSVGRRPTDLATSNDGSELLVMNHVDRSISVIDLVTLRVKETIALTAFDQWSGDSGDQTSSNLKVGKGSILYYSDGNWAPTLRVFDRATKQVLQTMQVGQNGFGDFALTSDYKRLIAWAQYGWTAGYAGSYLAAFSVSDTGTLTPAETTDTTYPTELSRDPLDTPVFVSSDNQLAFAKELVVKADAVRSTQQKFPTAVYSISSGGEVAATKSAIFETATGKKLVNLPVATTVQAITSDYARLAYFDAGKHAFGAINLLDAIGPQILKLTLDPPNGAIVLAPHTLRWQPIPGAEKYRVYLGTSSSSVAAAEPGSPLVLGETTSAQWLLSSALTPGVTYYWRVDTVTSSGVSRGEVYDFTVSDISASVSEINTATVHGHAHDVVPVDLASGSSAKSWQASSDQPWISFAETSGTTPSTLHVILNASNLDAGLHSGNVTITAAGGGAFVIPVKLRVDPLRLTILKSDRASSIVYGVSEDPNTPGSGAYLLEIDTAAEAISRVLPVGSSVTDLAVHSTDKRIYVPNWKPGSLLAIDQASFQQVRSYAFPPFGGVGYSQNDVYRVTAGATGRVITEANDQWINVSLFDTVAGTTLTKSFEREGGGAADPTGRFYYHGDNNNSGAQFYKYDLTGDKLTKIITATASHPLSGYGSRVVVASEDGSRVFWNGQVYNADLNVISNLPQVIYSMTTNGRYAFGEKSIYDTDTGQAVFGMPADTQVSAFNSTTKKLVVQVGSTIRFFSFATPTSMPAPVLTATTNRDGSVTLSWTDASLETGFTLQRRIAGTSQWEDVAVAIERNTTSITLRDLQAGSQYEFRIKADSAVSSSAWSPVATGATAAPLPSFANIATRLFVKAGDDAMIAGFIITGSEPKRVLIRGLGPQLYYAGLPDTLVDPTLELNKPDGSTVSNDEWYATQQQEIQSTGLAPNWSVESAIVATLDPGAYTATLRGKNNGIGLGLIEVYDLTPASNSTLANIATRGFVQTGDNALIGGIIVTGQSPANVLVRAIGPSLAANGVAGALQNPTLELYDAQGNVMTNDDWRTTQEAQILATGVAPTNDKEAAILAPLAPGGYTAVVRGSGDTSGIAVVEAYNIE